ncbi:MAG: peroxide stress protein YaaA [Actinomycetota bacterium]
MLIVVSPAKSLDYESPLPTSKWSEPQLLDRAAELVEIMATKSPADIKSMMGVSASLAETNFERYQDWHRPFTPDNARPALLAFQGDVYQGMDAANTFGARDYTHAQKTLRILSGLYGVLRPLDLMQPYRLEMGSKLANPAGRDLYAFWGSTITEHLNEALADSPGANVLVNLASNEYFGSVRPDALDAPVITPTFLDEKNGSYKTIAFFAKRARGSMTGWIIRNRVKTIKGLADFDGLGYRFDPDQSSAERPVFIRPEHSAAAA